MVLGNLTESLQTFVVFLQSHSSDDIYISICSTKVVFLHDVGSPLETCDFIHNSKWNPGKLRI